MTDQTITCPYCNKEIPLTETLFHQVEEDLRKEYEAQFADRLKTEKELLKQEARKARPKGRSNHDGDLLRGCGFLRRAD